MRWLPKPARTSPPQRCCGEGGRRRRSTTSPRRGQASLDDFARTTRDSTVAAALNSIPNALDTLGGRVSFIATAITATALRLTERRDVGRGLLPSRPGPAHGTTSVGSAIRAHRAATLGWFVGITAYGSVSGLAAVEIVDAAADSPTLTDYVADGTGTLTENYLATVAVMLAGYVIQQILRLAEDETSGRADLLLAAPISRNR